MGLSGRKQKQRIGHDPRNLGWAEDAARFGQNYLSKLGWDPSKGLGAGGDGLTTHLKVSQKLDMLGIGAAQQRDPNGIAWKQSKDFENLLRRLNDGSPSLNESNLKAGIGAGSGFVKSTWGEGEELEKKRKRPEKQGSDGEALEAQSKKQKRWKRNEFLKKAEETTVTNVAPVPRHRAYRARHIASKCLSSKSASAIAEILGVAPSATTPAPKQSSTAGNEDSAEPLEMLRTSTKSVSEYFRERLLAKSQSVPSFPSALPSPTETLHAELNSSDSDATHGLGLFKARKIIPEGTVSYHDLPEFACLTSSSSIPDLASCPQVRTTVKAVSKVQPAPVIHETQTKVAVEQSVVSECGNREKKKEKGGVQEGQCNQDTRPRNNDHEGGSKKKKKSRENDKSFQVEILSRTTSPAGDYQRMAKEDRDSKAERKRRKERA